MCRCSAEVIVQVTVQEMQRICKVQRWCREGADADAEVQRWCRVGVQMQSRCRGAEYYVQRFRVSARVQER